MKEHQHVEWKESWRDECLKWICGFANAEGGVLVIGRNDKGEAVGVANARKLLEDLPNKIRDVLGIMADVNLVKKSGKELIEIRVEPYPTPISYKGELLLSQRQHHAGTQGGGAGAVLDEKTGPHLGRCAGARASPCATCPVPPPSKLSSSGPAKAAGWNRPCCGNRQRESCSSNLELTEGKYWLKRAACCSFHDRPEKYRQRGLGQDGFLRDQRRPALSR